MPSPLYSYQKPSRTNLREPIFVQSRLCHKHGDKSHKHHLEAYKTSTTAVAIGTNNFLVVKNMRYNAAERVLELVDKGIAMDYEYYYNNARRRYYDACSEISSCENRIAEQKSVRQQKSSLINELNIEIQDNEEALGGVDTIANDGSNLDGGITKILNNIDSAATVFSTMVVASNVTNKNLSTAYSDKISKTKGDASSVAQTIRTKRSSLESKISSLRNELRNAEAELHEAESSIRAAESSLGGWKNNKRNASYDMEYYRRKMYSAV